MACSTARRSSPRVGRFPQGMIVQVPLFIDQLNGCHREHSTRRSCPLCRTVDRGGRAAGRKRENAPRRCCRTSRQGHDEALRVRTEGSEQVNLVALLDNLGKGASGAAVQNMDLMLGNA